MEGEILSFLKDPIEMKQGQAEALYKVLRDDLDCMEDVTRLTEKDWKEVFNKVGLKTAIKGRLYDAIKDMSKKRSIPTPANRTMNKQAILKKKNNPEITKVVLISKIVESINNAYVTLKVSLLSMLQIKKLTLYFFLKKVSMNAIEQHASSDSPNDEKWKHLEMQEGDEIECRYSINEASSVTIYDIQFPKVYSAHVLISSKESMTYIVPLSMQPRGLAKSVQYIYIYIYLSYLRQIKMLLDMTTKVVFWKSGATSTTEVEPRKDDIAQFRLRFVNDEWHPINVKLVATNSICLIFISVKS
ncbi:hypothetical protein RFI_24808 [Reticulomyxa filosa]|uniref:Uncharacterized protein n=1 Tax=Reticulomyxa filosa TaxID=46433 RepID=X6MFV6_RETFI|nr:hypothetical protein RFI_24808 [Reticulomyxa filosa]|eukprot:ETO12566.1 hypothetical protein RFI_24808 [Reticulomyxa filosa]